MRLFLWLGGGLLWSSGIATAFAAADARPGRTYWVVLMVVDVLLGGVALWRARLEALR